MARILEDFVGTYRIRHGQGSFGIIERGFQLCIGTDTYKDLPPDGVKVGVSIIDGSGDPVLPAADNPPSLAYLVDGTLNGSTTWQVAPDAKPELLSFQISLFTMRLPDRVKPYRAPSIMIIVGDPDNAGVWGAEDDDDNTPTSVSATC